MRKGTTLKGEILKLQGGPKQYKQGWTEFYKLKFFLTPDVLIPRPETELLVDEIIKLNPKTVIDIGTGSGAIAISVAKNLKNTMIVAVDISNDALAVAKKNAKFHHVESQIVFIQSDLLENFSKAPDIIVANLPYIPTARLMHIDPMVADFEPKIALDGGQDGFELYIRLFNQIKEKNLYPEYLIAEIDEEQGELAKSVLRNIFPNAQFELKKDLAKKDRILIVKFNL